MPDDDAETDVEDDDVLESTESLVDEDENADDDMDVAMDRLIGRAVTLYNGRPQKWFLAVWRDQRQ